GALRLPARGPVFVRPLVEVLAWCPESNTGVVRRASPQHLRPRVSHQRVAVLLRFNRVVPVVTGFEQLHPAVKLQTPLEVCVARTCLDEADGARGLLTQAGGDGGAGRSATDHDVVEGVRRFHHGLLYSRPGFAARPEMWVG